jgi:3'(2'), 5'-bisphosphate nucleotidase
MNQPILKSLIEIAIDAGKRTLFSYNDNMSIAEKSDHSPLTQADLASHTVIVNGLNKLFPKIPVLSEEGTQPPVEMRQAWERYFLIDPLDGTKEFIKRNGEFTVNIALIENNIPVIGVIYAPVLKVVYAGMKDKGAFKIDEQGKRTDIQVSSKSTDEELTVVQSRSHSGDEENEFYKRFHIQERISKGSSLKICMVAEGKAELYFRSGPTMEWDTAAGHAILSAAGGHFTQKDGSPFIYNKDNLLNPGFIAAAFEWQNREME